MEYASWFSPPHCAGQNGFRGSLILLKYTHRQKTHFIGVDSVAVMEIVVHTGYREAKHAEEHAYKHQSSSIPIAFKCTNHSKIFSQGWKLPHLPP